MIDLGRLSDKELESLHGDAIRQAQSGTGAQRTEAERLLPQIGREVERRRRRATEAGRIPPEPRGAKKPRGDA